MSNEITDHPAGADTLVRTLSAVAAQVEPAADWDQLLADISQRESGSDAGSAVKPPSNRPRLLAAAAALVVIGASGVALTTIVDKAPTEISATKPNYVLPGEVVLSEDPLTVLGVLGPEPQFDTSKLGQEIAFEPVEELDPELTELIERIGLLGFPYDGDHVSKITALGTVEGVPWMIMITDGPNSAGFAGEDPDANFRTRSVLAPDGGGGSHSAALVPLGSLELIDTEPNESSIGGGYSIYGRIPTDWVHVAFMPSGTAIVSYADDDQHLWMRPRSGVAAFPTEFEDGESFEVQAFDADGLLISGWSGTVYLD